MSPALRPVAVDLASLTAGGGNGGIKPLALEIVRGLRRASGGRARFLFLVRASAVAELAREMAKGDRMLVVERDARPRWWSRLRAAFRPGVTWCVGPRAAWGGKYLAGAGVLYCPFGDAWRFGGTLPSIALVADTLHRDFPASLPPAEIAAREERLREVLNIAAQIHCISAFAASRLREWYGLAPERIVVAPAWIHERIGPRPVVAGQAPSFIYPSNLWPHKNHETLLHAMALYAEGERRENREPWLLHLTGAPSPRENELKALAGRLGLAGLVCFHGHLSDAAFRRLLAGARAMVFPSCYEGFGIPMAEAMAWELPLVCADIPCAREVAADAALYFPPLDLEALAQRLREISGDPSLREALAAKGRARLAAVSFESGMENLWSALESLAA